MEWCHWFAMSSVCYNSLIYIWLNEHFRENAKQSLEYVLSCAKFYQQSNKKDIVGGQGVTTSRIGGGAGYTNASVVQLHGTRLLAQNLQIKQFDSTTCTNEKTTCGDESRGDEVMNAGDVKLKSLVDEKRSTQASFVIS